MSIRRACYVACDECWDPAEISTTDAEEARRYAARQGYVRIRRDGRLVDLCATCAAEATSVTPPGEGQ